MLRKTLIAAATTIALAGTAAATATPAAAAPAVTVDISWSGPGFKHGGHKHWNRGRACQPIVRWKKVGYRHHQRWQPVVVGWNCHGGHKGHQHRRWH